MKKPINTKTHGMLDYTIGPLVAMSPWLLGFGRKDSRAKWLPMALGMGTVMYSLFTRYELGARPRISMKNHLRLDTAAGALTATAPWLFGFSRKTFVPFVAMGLMELAVVALSQSDAPARRNKPAYA